MGGGKGQDDGSCYVGCSDTTLRVRMRWKRKWNLKLKVVLCKLNRVIHRGAQYGDLTEATHGRSNRSS